MLSEIDEYYRHFTVTSDLIEMRNLALVADLIIRSATARKESRGLHHILGYPRADPKLDCINTVLEPEDFNSGSPPQRAAGILQG